MNKICIPNVNSHGTVRLISDKLYSIRIDGKITEDIKTSSDPIKIKIMSPNGQEILDLKLISIARDNVLIVEGVILYEKVFVYGTERDDVKSITL